MRIVYQNLKHKRMVRFLAVVETVILTFGLVLGNKSHDVLRRKASTMTGPEPRIVNGVQVANSDYPWFVKSQSDIAHCGAVLIHPDIVLSAAHCQGAFNDGLIIWNEDGQAFNRELEIVEQVRHLDFDLYSHSLQGLPLVMMGDILVMKLSEPIYDITPISWNTDEGTPSPNEILSVIGYGLTSEEGDASPFLLKGDIPYIDSETCIVSLQLYYESIGMDAETALTLATVENGDHTLCTIVTEDEVDSCYGDSGGPLFTQDNPPLLVGVVSWGYGCARVGVPSFFTRISTYDSWIRQQICLMSVETPIYCDEYPPDSFPDTYIYYTTLEFGYDEDPWETTFAVRHFPSGDDTDIVYSNILYAGPMYVPESYDAWMSYFMLPPGTLALEVYDQRGSLSSSAWFRLNYTDGMLNEGSLTPTNLEFVDEVWSGTFILP